MRPFVKDIIDRLLRQDQRVISLNDVGDAIGTASITPAEIDQVFESLQAAGRQVQRVTPRVREDLALVLRAARQLKEQQTSSPSVQAIAAATGLDESAVRAALLYASVLGR